MANTNAPFGLREWIGTLGAGAYPSATIVRQIAYDNGTAIYTGDLVKNLDTGYVAQWSAGTAVSQLAGVFVGCKYKSTSMGRTVWSPYWPGTDVASTEKVYAYLVPCNLATPPVFLIQSDSTGVAFADIGLNGDVTVGSGSAATGRSGMVLNATSTLNTTPTLPLRIMGLYSDYGPPSVSGAQSGAYNWVIVAANVTGSTGI